MDDTKYTAGMISSRDAAKLYGVTHDHISRLCRQKKLVGSLQAGVWFVDRASLERFFSDRKVVDAPAPVYISSRDAAKLYGVTHDHISRLCRQKKLTAKQEGGVWYLDKNSLADFFAQQGKHPRAIDVLSLALPASPAPVVARALPTPVVEVPAVEVARPVAAPTIAKPVVVRRTSSATWILVPIVALLFVGGVLAASYIPNDTENLAAAASSGNVLSNFFTGLAHFFGGNSTTPVAVAPDFSAPNHVYAVSVSTSTVASRGSATVVTNTYPIRERVIEHITTNTVSGVSQSQFDQALNALRSQIAGLSSGPSGAVVPYAPAFRIDKLSSVAITGGSITNATISGGSLSNVSLNTADLSGTVAIANGGTGTSSAPSYGQLLIGNSAGGYEFVATSSLGLIVSDDDFAYPFIGNATSTTLTFSGGLLSATSTIGRLNATSSVTVGSLSGLIGGNNGLLYAFATSTIKTSQLTNDAGFTTFTYPFPSNATTTQIAFNGGATFAGATTTALAVTGSSTVSSVFNVGGVLNANGGVVGGLTGNASTATALQTARNINGVAFNGTSNITINAASSTLLADINSFSGDNIFAGNVRVSAFPSCTLMTDAAGNIICGTGGGGGGGTDGNFSFFEGSGVRMVTTTNQVLFGASATTSLAAFEVTGSAVTSAYFKNNVGIGTTSPFTKLSVVGNGYFAGSLTASTLVATTSASFASTTLTGNFVFANATGTNATTTSFAITNIASGNVLKTTTGGSLVAAVAGTDYVTGAGLASAYPFALTGNATSTLTQFNGGLTAFASSTIGAGGQTTGLTISGGATTTGNAYFGGSVGVNTVAPTAKFSIVTAPSGTTDSPGFDLLDTHAIGSVTTSGTRTMSVASTTFLPSATFAPASGLNTTVLHTSNLTTNLSGLTLGNLTITTSRNRITSNGSSVTVTGSPVLNDAGAGSGQQNQLTVNGFNSTVSVTPTVTADNSAAGTYLLSAGTFNNSSSLTSTILGAGVIAYGLNVTNSATLNNVSSVAYGGNFLNSAIASSTYGLLVTRASSASSANTAYGLYIAGPTNSIVNDYSLYSSGTAPSYFAGKLGVGTTSPFQTLSVSGSGYFDGSLTASAITATSSASLASTTLSGSTLLTNATTTNLFATLASTTSFFATNATTTTFAVTGISPGNLLKATTGGALTAAVAGTDYLTSANVSGYPFALAGNATSTLTQFNGGLTAFATSTIGAGGQTTGLTISGGATTTGNAYFAGNASVASTSPYARFSIDTSSLASGVPSFVVGSSTRTDLVVSQSGNVGIGTTSPGVALDIGGIPGAIYSRLWTSTSGSDAANLYRDDSNSSWAAGLLGSSSCGSGQYAILGGLIGSNACRLVISTGGNVGVASTTPWARLSVDTSSLGAGVPEFVIGSSTRTHMFVSQSGFVSFGTTTSLNAAQSVVGIDRDQNDFSSLTVSNFNTGSNASAGIGFYIDSSVVSGGFFYTSKNNTNYTGTSSLNLINVLNAPLGLGTNNTVRLAITSAGNVGIGTTTAKLFSGTSNKIVAIEGSTNPILAISNTTANKQWGMYVDSSGVFSVFDSASTSNRLSIAQGGNVGIGTTSPWQTLSVAGTIAVTALPSIGVSTLLPVCYDVTTGQFSRSTAVNTCDGGDGDLAEQFGSEEPVVRGQIVALGSSVASREYAVKNPAPGEATSSTYTISTAKVRLARAADRGSIVGAIPTAPFTIGSDVIDPADAPVKVALVGHVPIQMTLDGGDIAIGDPITVSVSTPGAGMKATTTGMILGFALEPFSASATSSDGMIEVSVRPQQWMAPSDMAALAQLGATTSVPALIQNSFASATNSLTSAIGAALSVIGEGVHQLGRAVYATVGTFNHLLTQTLIATDVTAETVHAQTLCIGNTCVTETQLKALLEGQGTASGGATTTALQGTTTPPTISINGNNPATIAVGDTYSDLGATAQDALGHDLTIRAFLNGVAVDSVSIDTSVAATSTVDYVATDTWGNTATSTRIVLIH